MDVSSCCFSYIKVHPFVPAPPNFSSAKLCLKCRDAGNLQGCIPRQGTRLQGLDLTCTCTGTPLVASGKSFINIGPVIVLSSPQSQNETAAKIRNHHTLSMANST
jgi:hypothetical protein